MNAVLGRLVHKADFTRLLQSAPWSRSTHFVVHHLQPTLLTRDSAEDGLSPMKLSTGIDPDAPALVDNLSTLVAGWIVPKRHARRAVTRSLVKRHMRCALLRHAAALPAGQWLLRLRAPFAPGAFKSARSTTLARAVRAELDALLTPSGGRRSPGVLH